MKNFFVRLWNAELPSWLFGVLLSFALLGFQLFNFSTTQYALRDVMGDLSFASIRWATILAIAFCGIDFAGIARIFTPEQGRNEPAEIWYLFGAWILAAAFNAMLTGWAVYVVSSSLRGSIVVGFLTWAVRLLIIGTFSIVGERVFCMPPTSMAQMFKSSSRAKKYR